VWHIRNKIDLAGANANIGRGGAGRAVYPVSAVTSEGLSALMSALTGFAAESLADGEGALITRERHRHEMNMAYRSLLEIADNDSLPEDLIAENLRRAAAAVGRLVGRVDVEDVLEAIFRDFCIGK
jgi:tRNA modification GTPase